MRTILKDSSDDGTSYIDMRVKKLENVRVLRRHSTSMIDLL